MTKKTTSPRKLNVAIAGLGRMGARHALHFLEWVPHAILVAAFTRDAKERAWAATRLVPWGVTLYDDLDAMLAHSGLEAVVVSTVTTAHAEQTVKAIDAGLHVLCEKPLSTSVELSQSIATASRRRPAQKVLCGFSRRFDASYRDAFTRVSNGDIGRATVLRSQTCDRLDPSGFFVAYAASSGGIFVDCAIHDIDLALWFFGPDSRVKSVSAAGVTAVHGGLRAHADVDNAVGVVEFWEGRIAYFYVSRIMAAGQHDMTEIVGTRGKIAVNANPMANLVEMSEAGGIRREIPPDYYGRFAEAFVTEANEFTTACLDGTELPFRLSGAVRAVEIGVALQESLRTGRKLWFDETGERVEQARL
ncbi:hypothetical protein CAC42_3510 [Sphaceloma murrayae]|uniref:Uncharacterized protein n=1 Tax=Sphaceloma murrayae TaxID=2082308 RepID=A0A2K1R1M0_9PEZI|nr:hypothetical protein CAC42_3510 [Sphaceloma murrayae]